MWSRAIISENRLANFHFCRFQMRSPMISWCAPRRSVTQNEGGKSASTVNRQMAVRCCVSRQFEARAPEANPSLRGQFSWPLLRLLPPRQRFAYYRGGFHSNATIKAAAAPTLLSYLMYILDIKECSLLFYVPSLSRAGCAFRHRTSLLSSIISSRTRAQYKEGWIAASAWPEKREKIYMWMRERVHSRCRGGLEIQG